MDGQEATAQAWWVVLRRKQASEEPSVTMKSVRDLLAGKIKGKELAALVEEAEITVKDRKREDDATRTLQAVGEVAVAAGEDDLAARYFTRAAEAGPSPAPLVRWGDVLAGRKRWEKAAEAYASAWEKDRKQPLALYLRGNALARAGRKTEGEAMMEQSHWLPLGDDTLRQIAELRVFAGLSTHETASVLRIGTTTVRTRWMIARAWLEKQIQCA